MTNDVGAAPMKAREDGRTKLLSSDDKSEARDLNVT